jgi:hypothetical protein
MKRKQPNCLLKLKQKALAVEEQEVQVQEQELGDKGGEHQVVVDKEAAEAAEDNVPDLRKRKEGTKYY